MAEKVIATFDRPRYAVQREDAPGKWRVVLTGDNVFNMKLAAEKYTAKHDVATRVVDRRAD